MPFADQAIRIDLACGKRPDGHWRGTLSIRLRAEELRKYGLHPDQPWSKTIATRQPAWWRAQALRLMLDTGRHRRSRRE